jgi:hypothetical protein
MNISVDAVIILSGATTVLSSVVSYFLIRLIRSNDDFQKSCMLYQTKTTAEINEIKYNYLDRFDKVKNQIMESELRIISNISGQFRRKIDSE